MTLEDKFRKQMGDLTFTITVLQHQLEEAQAKLDSYTNLKSKTDKEIEDVRSTKS